MFEFFHLIISIVLAILLSPFSSKPPEPKEAMILEALSFTEWQTGNQIRKEVLKRYNYHMPYGVLYATLSQLEQKELVVYWKRRKKPGLFKKNPSGGRKHAPDVQGCTETIRIV